MALHNVTVFGGSGFLGRYVVRRLAARGVRVRVAVRDPERAQFLKPMGDVGQVMPFAANVRHEGSVHRALEGADAVVNLVGILHESGKQRFASVHMAGAGRIAAAAAAAGTTRLVHVSALGADPASPAEYGRSKAAGERAVREALAEANIVRPSFVFGPEDRFFNRFGAMARLSPFLPLIGGGHTRGQPVYAGDVAEAIVRILEDAAIEGQLYELGGPQVYSFKELMQIVLDETGRRRLLLPIPFPLAKLQAFFLGLLPNPPLTMDQVEMLKGDSVVREGAQGLAALGIAPTPLEAVLPRYMYRYRRGGRMTASRFG